MKHLILVFTLLCASLAANAATITTNFSYGPATTDWNQQFALPQFNPVLGTLQSVYFEMTTNFVSNVRFESLDAQARTISYEHTTDVVMQGAVTGLLITLQPTRTGSATLTAYDGSADFGGTSGRTLSQLTLAESGSITLVSPVTLAQYIGGGNLLIDVSATGSSKFTGSANLLALALASVGADAKVVYTYDASPVPEPATYAMMGAGLIGIALIRRRV